MVILRLKINIILFLKETSSSNLSFSKKLNKSKSIKRNTKNKYINKINELISNKIPNQANNFAAFFNIF